MKDFIFTASHIFFMTLQSERYVNIQIFNPNIYITISNNIDKLIKFITSGDINLERGITYWYIKNLSVKSLSFYNRLNYLKMCIKR